MIRQNISLDYLVPIALTCLMDNPFAAGDFYQGDLLTCVLKIEQRFWEQNPDMYHQLDVIISHHSTTKDENDKNQPNA